MSAGAYTSTASAVSPDSQTLWNEPGAWPVAPGIHRIPLPLPMDGLRAINVYVIETDQGLTLIDGGWAIEEARTQLEDGLRSIGYAVSDIRSFLVTHAHRDHYTQAVAVRREFGSHVSLGIGERPSLRFLQSLGESSEDPHVALLAAAGAERLAHDWSAQMGQGGLPDLSVWADPDSWLTEDRTLQVGDRAISAVHTPGHTQGHFVFADEGAGLLFAGDHVLPTITPSIGFEPAPAEQPLGDFMASLTKVRSMPDLRLLPAHGPVTDSSHQRIDQLLDHHEARLSATLAAVRAGARTPYDVAGRLSWTRRERSLGDLNFFDAALATMETRQHLQLLVARGTLVRGDGTPVEYAPVGSGPAAE